MNPGRWRHIADTYADIGMLPKDFPLDGFLYSPNFKLNTSLLYRGLLLCPAAHCADQQALPITSFASSASWHAASPAGKLAEQREISRSNMLELLANGAPLNTILEDIVRSVEQANPAMLCSIMLLDNQGKHLLTGAAPSLPDFFNQAHERH